MYDNIEQYHGNEIAIIGMSGRFPGAKNIQQYRHNLMMGMESTTYFTDEELLAANVPAELLKHPNYVKAKPLIDNIEWFDAGFFEVSPQESEILDPQQRLFLECSWEGLEDAGIAPAKFDGRIGVYAGVDMNTYLINNLLGRKDQDILQLITMGDKDYLATRVSYKLNLHGPSVAVQCACSTGLVAVHMGCESILNGESDVVICGAVSLAIPNISGYISAPGSILSPDGHCRPFDANAQGTVFGSGAGVVVLKKLSVAQADGDSIYAIIKGSAVNNDGSRKMSYTAPSLEGQALSIAEAQEMAGVSPESISYIETHGTGTNMGDPIEVAAMTKVFRRKTKKMQYCGIGSVKSNFGHLSTAAGIVSLIKATLSVHHRELYPSINIETPNPQLHLQQSPFYINSKYQAWQPSSGKRYCGVSSFGMGGTNAHMILEEFVEPVQSESSVWPYVTIPLSAKNKTAFANNRIALLNYLNTQPQIELADLAYTLQQGRADFSHRGYYVCQSLDDLKEQLTNTTSAAPYIQKSTSRPLVLMFSGQGSQYVGMAKDLYDDLPEFRQTINQCRDILLDLIQEDICEVIFAGKCQSTDLTINDTRYAQLALFVTEYSLAKCLIDWNFSVSGMIGHSIGEYVAACIAGVFSLEDALSLVNQRGILMQQAQRGKMLAVMSNANSLASELVSGELTIAAYNSPNHCVIGGSDTDIAELQQRLESTGILCQLLATSHAFHTRHMASAAKAFIATFSAVTLNQPQQPFVSNVTGKWITNEEATNPIYWSKHIVNPVRFQQGLSVIAEDMDCVFLEVGPGTTLRTFVQSLWIGEKRVASTIPHIKEKQSSLAALMQTFGELWSAGAHVPWKCINQGRRSKKIHLPTYQFDRTKYWRAASGKKSGTITGTPRAETLEQQNLYARPDIETQWVKPQSDIERKVAEVWTDVLAISNVGLDDNFFDLGGNSLLAPLFAQKMQGIFDKKFSIEHLFTYPTVRQQVYFLNTMHVPPDEQQDYLTKEALLNEVVLDPSIAAAGRDVNVTAARTILLTGATGFLGSYLLAELLNKTEATIYCIVRASTDDEAQQRVYQVLTDRLIWQQSMKDRIIALAGNMETDRLGLGADNYQCLQNHVDAIYHCAAWVNFTYPYEVLKAVNVNSMKEILNIATTGKLKQVHHISTLAVFGLDVYERSELISESHSITEVTGPIIGGYSQSKWVAEQLGLLAKSRGVPVSIYRIGSLGGHSRTGNINTSDYIWMVVKSCIQLGKIPEIDNMALDVTPVDYVAKAIVNISCQNPRENKICHFFNPNPLDWSQLAEWTISKGYKLDSVKYDEWSSNLLASFATSSDNALFPFLSLFTNLGDTNEHLESSHTFEVPGRYSCEQTLARLQGTGIQCPKVDEYLLEIYFYHLMGSGFLPTPSQQRNLLLSKS